MPACRKVARGTLSENTIEYNIICPRHLIACVPVSQERLGGPRSLDIAVFAINKRPPSHTAQTRDIAMRRVGIDDRGMIVATQFPERVSRSLCAARSGTHRSRPVGPQCCTKAISCLETRSLSIRSACSLSNIPVRAGLVFSEHRECGDSIIES